MSRDWQAVQIERALREGVSKNASSETNAIFVGDARVISTFEGPRWLVNGQLDLWHYASKVMCVDFDEDRVTDFGYHRYSQQTTARLSGWMRALHRMSFLDVESLSSAFWPFDWTWNYKVSPKAKPSGEGWHEDMRERFRAKAPWAQWVDGKAWFHAPKWNAFLNARYAELHLELLQDRLHTWYTGDWDAQGRWNKRFIDADAERRWKAYQKRQQRAAARLRAAYTSDAPEGIPA